MPLPTPFPLRRIQIDCVADTAFPWPHYAGSMLRGAFGHALRCLSCVTGAKTCTACPVRAHCAYGTVFEPSPPVLAGSPVSQQKRGVANVEVGRHRAQTTNPPAYVIEPPPIGARVLAAGETIRCHLVLIGHARQHQALLLHALERALPDLSEPRGALRMTGHRVLEALPQKLDIDAQDLTLTFSTPLRVQRNGKPVFTPQDLTARDVLMAAVKRVAQVCETLLDHPTADFGFQELAAKAAHITLTSHLTWHDLARYSSRQRQRIPLGGLLGRVRLQGSLTSFMPYLHLGQWLHIGKETAFGLGGYTLESRQPSS